MRDFDSLDNLVEPLVTSIARCALDCQVEVLCNAARLKPSRSGAALRFIPRHRTGFGRGAKGTVTPHAESLRTPFTQDRGHLSRLQVASRTSDVRAVPD